MLLLILLVSLAALVAWRLTATSARPPAASPAQAARTHPALAPAANATREPSWPPRAPDRLHPAPARTHPLDA